MRARGQAGDLTARELDRAVAGESRVAAQDSRRAESRAAAHIDERLVRAGADEVDLARIVERRRVTSSDAESAALPTRRKELLVSVPPTLRIVPPALALSSTYRIPVLSRKVVTLFVPADLKRRSDESVIELTVPIVAEATARPLAILTSELASGTPTGLQLSGSFQFELTAPVQVDLLMMFSPWVDGRATPARGDGGGKHAQTNFTSVPVPLSWAREKSECL
jgi:hypothetical protein